MANYNEAFNRSVYPKNTQGIQGIQGIPRRYDININKTTKGDTIPAILVVDSTQRNRDIYENAGQYTLDLPKIYTDVISVELMQANVPNSSYTISSRNNIVTFNVGVNNLTATLTTGNYTSTGLATELQRAMLAAAAAQFVVTYNPTIQRFTVTGNTAFSFIPGILYGSDAIIGLGSSVVRSVGATLTFPYNVVMSPNKYIILNIDGMNRCDGNSSAIANSFCVIPVDSSTTEGDFTLKTGNNIDNDTYIFYYTEPLPKLAKLKITFYTPDGSIYDFNGKDHLLVFQITCLSRPSKI